MPLTQQAKRDFAHMKFLVFLSITIITSQFIIGCSPLIIAGGVAGAGATVAADRRSADKLIEDQAIEIQATDYLYSHKEFGKEIHISVTSFNGTVLLTGETLSNKSKQTIINKINQMRGVKKVIDVIEVKKLASASDRSNDVWITSKVKSHLIAQKGLLTRSKVVTSASNVYLMGIVNNKEANQIVNIVKNVNGVETVTPLFESRDGSLEESLSATAHIKPMEKPQQELEETTAIEDEDDITVQPYTLQPAIRMNTDE